MDTLLLDATLWDLVVDLNGNIAVASDPYSQAQDAASEIRTFNGEVYYDTTKGLPYWESFLGQPPPIALIKAKIVAACLLVPGVVSALPFISKFVDRIVFGQVQITNDDGTTSTAAF
jgi:hypothetical protein